MNNSALAYSVRDACLIACTGRASVYEAIRTGELHAVKRGRRTLIFEEDLRRWLQNLPRITVNPAHNHSTKEASMTDTNDNIDLVQNPKEKAMTSNDSDAETIHAAAAVPSAKTIDFNAIRSRDFADPADVTSLVTRVPVRRPSGHTFVRVHPNKDYRFPVDLIELPEEDETYLIYSNEVAAALDEVRKPCMLYAAINRQGTLFLWPVKLPRGNKKLVAWHTSATEAAEKAMKVWVRINADMSLGAYKITIARGAIPDPEWPNLTFEELLRIAFRDRLVDTLTHPLVRRYLGDT
jgi:hypothetical protein